MRAIFSVMFCVAFLALPATFSGAQDKPTQELKPKVINPQYEVRMHKEAGGKSLPYRLLVPKDYKKGEHRPLLVYLHGSGEKGNDNNAQVKYMENKFVGGSLGTKFPAFVMFPQCPSDDAWHSVGFNDPPPVPEPTRMVVATVEELVKEFGIDDRRIYVGGFSMGGLGTWELLKRYPDLFAAGFAIAGGPIETPGLGEWLKNIPIWVFQGDKDKNVPVEWARKIVADLKAAGGKVKYTEVAGGGHDPQSAFTEPELPVWLLAQKRDKPARFAEAKLPERLLTIVKTLPDKAHGTWDGTSIRTGKKAARVKIGELSYTLEPSDGADKPVTDMLAKVASGEISGTIEVTGTVRLESRKGYIVVEKLVVKK